MHKVMRPNVRCQNELSVQRRYLSQYLREGVVDLIIDVLIPSAVEEYFTIVQNHKVT